MNVVINDSKLINFCDIKIGSCFRFEENIYLKTDNFRSFCITENYSTDFFNKSHEVEQVIATITVNI